MPYPGYQYPSIEDWYKQQSMLQPAEEPRPASTLFDPAKYLMQGLKGAGRAGLDYMSAPVKNDSDLMGRLTDPALVRMWTGGDSGAAGATVPIPPAVDEPAPEPAPMAPAPPVAPTNPYMAILEGLLGQRTPGVGAMNYPAPPNVSMNMPAYPSSPVPQRAQPSEVDYGATDEYLRKGEPTPYKADKNELLIALLAGAAGGFGGMKPGDRLGSAIARAGAGGAGAYLGQKGQHEDKELRSAEDLRRYYLTRASVEGGRAEGKAARADRGADVDYANAQGRRQDEFERNEYSVRAQQMANALATGNWDRAMQLSQQMRGDQYKNAELAQRDRSIQMSGFGRLATATATAQNQGKNTLGALPPGAAVSRIVGEAIKMKRPIPGYDISELQTAAAASIPKELRQTFSLNPQAQKDWIDQRVAAAISQDMAQNPEKMQMILAMFRGNPIGGGSPAVIERGLGGDDE